uniref:NADH-ubiquinone oxidoreductase chain 5 n=1 Tax=Trichodectes canis TaxID=209909 RepID=A0A386B2A1_9NEOP|nr:NADH dehydrogenase subunit 5 [Trichodectes canis]
MTVLKLGFPILFSLMVSFVCLLPSFTLIKPMDYNMSMDWDLILTLDYITFFFVLVVLSVSYSVFSYSWGYLHNDQWWNKFIMVLFVFVVSMLLLSISGSVFFSMFGWDGLGLSSVALIYFYRGWVSFHSGLVTFYCNRFGDLFLILSIILVSASDLLFFEYSMFLVVGALTKTAQFPFHVWLPMAMAAPTPVSSLVHSSTLVTAGIYILMRYYHSISPLSLEFMFWVSFMTMIYSGLKSLLELDLKKVIAYSTLVHLSMMITFYSVGDFYPSLVHLACHAFMKSTLFMMAGVMIHNNWGYQDSRIMSSSTITYPMVVFVCMASCSSMVGLPFLSGFYSKELMLSESLQDSSLTIPFITGIMGLFFTSAYSTRILLSISISNPYKLVLIDWASSKLMLNPITLNFIGLVVLGSILVHFDNNSNLSEAIYLMMNQKILMLHVFVFGMITGYLISKYPQSTEYNKINYNNKNITEYFPMFELSWSTVVISSNSISWINTLKMFWINSSELSKLSSFKIFMLILTIFTVYSVLF